MIHFKKPKQVGYTLSVLAMLITSALIQAIPHKFIYSNRRGEIPNQKYRSEQVGHAISPQMGQKLNNQPFVFDGYAILSGNSQHEIWDISNPSEPFLVSEFESDIYIRDQTRGDQESHQVTMSRDEEGHYYLATASGLGVDIWDLSDTHNPVAITNIPLPGVYFGDLDNAVWGLSWQGRYLYVGATNQGLFVLDMQDIHKPQLLKHLSLSELGGVKAGPLFAIGNLLVLTTPKNHFGLITLDISEPAYPIVLDIHSPNQIVSYIGGFYDRYAVMLNPVRVYDVTSDPNNIQLVKIKHTEESEYLTFDQGKMFLGGIRGRSQGVNVYNFSLEDDMEKVIYIPGRDSLWDDQFTCPIGNLVLISDDQLVASQFNGSFLAVHQEEPDTLGPRVLYTNPAAQEQKVKLSSSIGISFSDWIEFKSVDFTNFIVRPVGGNPISGKWGWLYTTLTFNPTQNLQANTEYEVILTEGGITDLVGNPTKAYSFTFNTGQNIQKDFYTLDVSGNSPSIAGEPLTWKVKNPKADIQYEWILDGELIGEGPQLTFSGKDTSTNPMAKIGRYSPCVQMVQKNAADTLTSIWEAEEAQVQRASIRNNHPGFLGYGYIDFRGNEGDDVWAEFSVFQEDKALSNLRVRYLNSIGPFRKMGVYVNDTFVQWLDFPKYPPYTWSDTLTDIELQAGWNSVKLVANAGTIAPHLDQLQVVSRLFPKREVHDSKCFSQIVYKVAENRPSSSKAMIAVGDTLWAVNKDNHTVSAVHTKTQEKIWEIPVGQTPTAICQVNHTIWVANRESGNISILDLQSGALIKSLNLPYASQPNSVLVSPKQDFVLIGLSAIGQLVKVNPDNYKIMGQLSLASSLKERAPQLGGMALNARGDTLLINRFISQENQGLVYAIDPKAMQVLQKIPLYSSKDIDASNKSRGIPNYLESIAINPQENEAWVASKKDNLERGSFRDGLSLDHQTTVRAITSRINLHSFQERLSDRIDFDNRERCNFIDFNSNGDLAFVCFPGNHKVAILDVHSGKTLTEINTGQVPDAALFDDSSQVLYVHNFLSRSISAFDISPVINSSGSETFLGEINLVTQEILSEEVLRGKILFYNASSTRLNQDGYMSCASCHLDGGHDGSTWDLTSLGEGLRNTIDLRGKAGTAQGPLHWTGNFDEVHDFENQIRLLGAGTGLMETQDFQASEDPLGPPKAGLSDDLDALSAYVTSLAKVPASPYRPGRELHSEMALQGRQIFLDYSCTMCHTGPHYTDSPSGVLHNIGTVKEHSGKRIGKNIPGFDTPGLQGIWSGFPFLHDGSATSIKQAIQSHRGYQIPDQDLATLEAFLLELDGEDSAIEEPSNGIKNGSYYLEVPQSEYYLAYHDENNLQIEQNGHLMSQSWRLSQVKGNVFTIRHEKSNLFLASTSQDCKQASFTWLDSSQITRDSHHWLIQPQGKYFAIKPKGWVNLSLEFDEITSPQEVKLKAFRKEKVSQLWTIKAKPAPFAFALEAECSAFGTNWKLSYDKEASNGAALVYELADSPNTSNHSPDPIDKSNDAKLSFTYEIDHPGSYQIWVRCKTLRHEKPSLWVRLGQNSWTAWAHDFDTFDVYTWVKLNLEGKEGPLFLEQGQHTLEFLYGESLLYFDKVFFSLNELSPQTWAGTALHACSLPDAAVSQKKPQDLRLTGTYPNPLEGGKLTLKLSEAILGETEILIKNAQGDVVLRLHQDFKENTRLIKLTLDTRYKKKGIHFITVQVGEFRTRPYKVIFL